MINYNKMIIYNYLQYQCMTKNKNNKIQSLKEIY